MKNIRQSWLLTPMALPQAVAVFCRGGSWFDRSGRCRSAERQGLLEIDRW